MSLRDSESSVDGEFSCPTRRLQDKTGVTISYEQVTPVLSCV